MSEFGMRPSIEWMHKYFKNREVKIAELGVFKGINAERFLTMLNVEELHLIDLWITPDNLKMQYNYDAFYKNVCEKFKDSSNIKLLREDTVSASKHYVDNYFDIVYVDADHSYEGCKRDIEAWYPKVKKGGVLVGHDYYCCGGVYKAVNEKFDSKFVKIFWDAVGMYDKRKYGEWAINK